MDCQLPDVLDALADGPAPDVRMVAPPPWIGPDAAARAALRATARGAAAPDAGRADGGPVGAPAPSGPRGPGEMARTRPVRGVYGERLAYSLDSRHFTVQWSHPDVDPSRAAEILGNLEDAWTVLVDEAGWPAPISSEDWLLWVILDPELGGSGYTTVYTSEAFPEGYPVTWLNPTYDAAADPAFALSVAVHEFAHMLQYRLRDRDRGRDDAWYWEATAEWAAERAAPELDTYAESTWWYAQWPDAPFDAYERFHPYGMVVLNAYLDEHAVGFDGIRRVWRGARDAPWDARIAEVTGQDFGTLVADMAAALAAGTLRESALYFEPVRARTHAAAPTWETLELPGLYGSYYVDVAEGPVVATGPVLARYVQDGVVLPEAPATGPYTAVFTAVGEDGALGYGTTPPTGNPGAERPCGCATSPGPGALGPLGLALGLGLAARRRRP